MMTDAIKKEDIKTKYNEAREKLQKAISVYSIAYKRETLKGSHSLGSVYTAFNSISGYLNWGTAFKELDSSVYNDALKVESDTLDTLSSSIDSYTTAITSLKSDATDSEIKAVVSSQFSTLRNDIKNYKPSTILGIPTAARYQDKLFLTEELKAKKNEILDEAEGGKLYTIDRENQDYFVNHLYTILSDSSKTSQQIEESFQSFVNSYYSSVVTSSLTDADESLAYVNVKAAEYLESYKTAAAPYFQELVDTAISAYSQLKNDATDENRKAYNVAISNAKTVLSKASSNEEKVFASKVAEEYYNFILQLAAMGENL